MKTKREITMDFRDHGPITIPKGTRVSPAGDGEFFAENFGTYLPKNSIQMHDATYYGIRIKADEVEP